MGAALVGKTFQRGRSALAGGLVAGVFAVENAQGVFAKTTLGIFAEGGGFGGEELDQFVAVAGFAVFVAEAVDAEGEVFDAAAAVEIHLEEDALDVLLGFGDAEGFDAELMVDAEPALLRAFVAEVGAEVVDLGTGSLLDDEAVFDGGANHAGGAFGAEGDGFAFGAGAEGEGFLLDNVAGFTDAAMEQLGVFVDGGADFGEVIEISDFPGDALDGLPLPTVGRENVGGAARGVNGGHGEEGA